MALDALKSTLQRAATNRPQIGVGRTEAARDVLRTKGGKDVATSGPSGPAMSELIGAHQIQGVTDTQAQQEGTQERSRGFRLDDQYDE